MQIRLVRQSDGLSPCPRVRVPICDFLPGRILLEKPDDFRKSSFQSGLFVFDFFRQFGARPGKDAEVSFPFPFPFPFPFFPLPSLPFPSIPSSIILRSLHLVGSPYN